MCRQALCSKASHQDAFDEIASFSGVVESGLTFLSLGMLDLVPLLHAAVRDEEVVDPDHWNHGLLCAPMLGTTSASHDAPFAPQPERNMRTSMTLHFLLARQLWVTGNLDGLDVAIDLGLVDVDLLRFRRLLKWSHNFAHPLPGGRGATTNGLAGSYRLSRGWRRLAYRLTPCRGKLDIRISARYKFPSRLYWTIGFTLLRISSTTPGGTTTHLRLVKSTSCFGGSSAGPVT